MQPRRNIAFAMQNSPYINAINLLEIKHQIRKSLAAPKPQTGKIQAVRISRRASSGVALNMVERCLKLVNEIERGFCRILLKIILNGLKCILLG